MGMSQGKSAAMFPVSNVKQFPGRFPEKNAKMWRDKSAAMFPINNAAKYLVSNVIMYLGSNVEMFPNRCAEMFLDNSAKMFPVKSVTNNLDMLVKSIFTSLMMMEFVQKQEKLFI